MKKYGVILYVESDNFGDDIQTYVASKLLPHVDYVIDREHMDTFSSDHHEPVFCIMNGWYLYETINWPPSKDIIPLPISMHFTYSMLSYPSSKDLFVLCLNRYFNFFSKYGVGCRDTATVNLLKKDIRNVYLSYCLTLTLNKFDIPDPDHDYICLVDVSDKVRDYVYKNASCEVREYTHDYRNKTFENISFEDRMNNVEERLKIYQNAKCVITSRYHAAMPSLALGTPVVLIPSSYEPNRFADLDDLLCICNENDFISGNVFDINHPKSNSKKYVEIADDLRKRVKQFIDDDGIIDTYSELISFCDVKDYLKQLEKLSLENSNLKRILWANHSYVHNDEDGKINSFKRELDLADERYLQLNEKYNDVIRSRSWKITALYRKIGGFIKKVLKK